MKVIFPYVPLPGRRRGWLRKSSLWEGADHLLLVKGTRFHEEYRRFYYSEIQALFLERRPRVASWGGWAVRLTVLTIATLIAFQAVGASSRIGATAIAAVLGIYAGIQLFIDLRRSCRCSLQTAVGREVLPSLFRVSAAEKVFARVGELITAVQVQLPEELPDLEESVLASLAPGALPQTAPSVRIPKPAHLTGLLCAATSFAILLVNALAVYWNYRINTTSERVTFWSFAWIAAESALGLLALFRLRDSINLSLTRGTLFTLLIVSSLRLAAVYLWIRMAQLQLPGLKALSSAEYPGYIAMGVEGALALMGLLSVSLEWKKSRGGQPSQS